MHSILFAMPVRDCPKPVSHVPNRMSDGARVVLSAMAVTTELDTVSISTTWRHKIQVEAQCSYRPNQLGQ